jgi:uncharacterized membrane protein YdjX (TVP38/TMEM64 family)
MVMTKRHYILLLILVTVLGILLMTRCAWIWRGITLDNLKFYREYLHAFVGEHHMHAVLLYVGLYVLSIMFFLPIAALCTMAGGFLFGTWWGALYADIAATVGSMIGFLLVRYSLGSILHNAYKEQLRRFNHAIEEDAARYLLAIHCVPVVPFSVINLLAGLTHISWWTFAWTTAIGIIPLILIYAFAGSQLHTIESIHDVLSWNVMIALALIAAIILLPALVKRFKLMRSVIK